MKTALPLFCLSLSLALGSALAEDSKPREKAERKTVTLISAEGKADGSTEISREAVRECVVSLPAAEALQADVTADSRFLREIDGDPGKNAWTKIYAARITINYMVYKKDLLVVATKSVEGMAPTFREVEKRLPQTREFVSNPSDGDTYAGRSNRQYYFTKAEDAVKDAKRRAQVWLNQQGPLLCGDIR